MTNALQTKCKKTMHNTSSHRSNYFMSKHMTRRSITNCQTTSDVVLSKNLPSAILSWYGEHDRINFLVHKLLPLGIRFRYSNKECEAIHGSDKSLKWT